jgi:hypothetical protein
VRIGTVRWVGVPSAVKTLVESSLGGLSYGRLLANAASVLIIALGVIAALDQLNIAENVVERRPVRRAYRVGRPSTPRPRGQTPPLALRMPREDPCLEFRHCPFGLASLVDGLDPVRIAAGIEEPEQPAIGTDLGWTHGQGYRFGGPPRNSAAVPCAGGLNAFC